MRPEDTIAILSAEQRRAEAQQKIAQKGDQIDYKSKKLSETPGLSKRIRILCARVVRRRAAYDARGVWRGREPSLLRTALHINAQKRWRNQQGAHELVGALLAWIASAPAG